MKFVMNEKNNNLRFNIKNHILVILFLIFNYYFCEQSLKR